MPFPSLIPGADKITDEDVILVTGGSGLYGQGVKTIVEEQKLKGKWIFLRSKDCDLRVMSQCKELFELHKPTFVIHLAAFVGGLFRNLTYKIRFWMDNVDMNNNVLQLCQEYKVKKCVSCLSTCVFPENLNRPMVESDLNVGTPHKGNDAYAYAKRMMHLFGKYVLPCGNFKYI